ncbi:MAG: alpha/beta fold hydrolase [Pseudomonadota bacterium]
MTRHTLAAIRAFSPVRHEPKNFDSFWELTRGELADVEAKPVAAREANPRPGLTLDRLQFSSLGEERINGYLLSHDDAQVRPLIVHSHGYNSCYDVMLHWALAGYHVCGLDVRGFGRSNGVLTDPRGYVLTGITAPGTSILRGAVADLARAVEVAQTLLSWRTTSLVLYGFSFGGALGLMSAAAMGLTPNLLVIGQPTFGWQAERLRLAKAGSAQELKLALEAGGSRDQFKTTLNYFDSVHYASRLNCPVLLGVGLDDDVVPSRTVLAIFNALCAPQRELRLLPVAHSSDPRESLWARFDEEWLSLMAGGALPLAFGDEGRLLGVLE